MHDWGLFEKRKMGNFDHFIAHGPAPFTTDRAPFSSNRASKVWMSRTDRAYLRTTVRDSQFPNVDVVFWTRHGRVPWKHDRASWPDADLVLIYVKICVVFMPILMPYNVELFPSLKARFFYIMRRHQTCKSSWNICDSYFHWIKVLVFIFLQP